MKDYKQNEFDALLEAETPTHKTIVMRKVPNKEETSYKTERENHTKDKAVTQRQTFEDNDSPKTDIVLQRKKRQPTIIALQQVAKDDSKKLDSEDNNTSSIIEEQDDYIPSNKVAFLKPVDSLPVSMESHPKSQNASLTDFKNNKKITSLDELYIQNNYFSKNPNNPFTQAPINFDKEGFVVHIHEARYLPDTVNFVKVKAMIFGANTGIEGKVQKEILQIEGDINTVLFNLTLKVEKLSTTNYDDLHLFLFWETFQDIFGDDDVEFIPIVFGFSLVKLFQSEGIKSLDSCVESYHLEMAHVRRTAPDSYFSGLLFESGESDFDSHVPVDRYHR